MTGLEDGDYSYATDLAAQRVRAEIGELEDRLARKRTQLRTLYLCGARKPRRTWRERLRLRRRHGGE